MSLLQVQDLSVIATHHGRDVTLVDRVSFVSTRAWGSGMPT
jgi:hypothetical protein